MLVPTVAYWLVPFSCRALLPAACALKPSGKKAATIASVSVIDQSLRVRRCGGCDSCLFVPFGGRRWDGDLDGQTEERDDDDDHETVTAFAAEYRECVLFAVLRSRALNL